MIFGIQVLSNLHNSQGMIIEMSSYSYHMTQNQTQKHANNGDNGYMLLWEKFHWYIIFSFEGFDPHAQILYQGPIILMKIIDSIFSISST